MSDKIESGQEAAIAIIEAKLDDTDAPLAASIISVVTETGIAAETIDAISTFTIRVLDQFAGAASGLLGKTVTARDILTGGWQDDLDPGAA
jgi:hypothetical protein